MRARLWLLSAIKLVIGRLCAFEAVRNDLKQTAQVVRIDVIKIGFV
jgi:hypothetical protein